MEDATIALVGLAVVLAKIIEKLIEFGYGKLTKDKEDEGSTKLEECHELLKALTSNMKTMSDITVKIDGNGVPMVYFSRNLEIRQMECINLLHEMNHSQINMIKILDRIADRIIDLDKTLYEMRK